jgi:peptidoglycan hydrolase-like protein with peptidoglycan-binding domain
MPDYPELKKGDSGEAVTALQELLIQLPWLNVDGKFGPITDEMVKAFQLSKGLNADGIVGPDTWKAIESSVEELKSAESS